jgi:hypothetical protein
VAEVFAILSGLIVLIGAPPYLFDILKGKTKPERATWFIWSVQGCIAFGSQAVLGAHWSLWFVGLNAAGNLAVWLLSLKYGVGGWKRIDIAALIIAAVGLLLSLVTRNALLALWGVVIADFAGVIPTLQKTYHHPESETTITWFALGTSSLLAVGSVGTFKFSLLLYPIYFTFSNYVVLVAQALGKRAQPHKA